MFITCVHVCTETYLSVYISVGEYAYMCMCLWKPETIIGNLNNSITLLSLFLPPLLTNLPLNLEGLFQLK